RYACQFLSPDGGFMLELHWGITEWYFAFALDADYLGERRETVSLLGTSVSSIAAEDLLLLLTAHGTKHGWERLAWICDIAELLRARPEMAWKQVLEQADRLGSKRMLFLGLLLAQDCLGAAVPEEVRNHLQADSVVRVLAAEVRQRLFRETK